MIKGRENLNYDYYNQYLINCEVEIPEDLDIIHEFFVKKLNIIDNQELDPKKIVLLCEFIKFLKTKPCN